MRRFIYILFVGLILISCNRREEIPQKVLSSIIEETILTSAAVEGIPSIRDSVENMDYYTPILKKYGYTIEDMQYTITKMISRKTPVINIVLTDARKAIDNKKWSAEQIYKIYSDFNKQIDKLYIDTIFTLQPDINFTKRGDINKTKYFFPLDGDGSYKIRVYYSSTSMPDDTFYYANFNLLDSLVESYSGKIESRRYTFYIQGKQKVYNSHIEFRWDIKSDENANIAELNLFANRRYDGYLSQNRKLSVTKKKDKKIDMTIDSIFLIKSPYYKDIIDELLIQQYGYKSVAEYLGEEVAIKVPYEYEPIDSLNILEREEEQVRCELMEYMIKKEHQRLYPVVVDTTKAGSEN